MNVEQALELELPHAEKLVLVYLASRASAVGVGAWDRDHLEATLGYKRRSAQRLLKSLRDMGVLRDINDAWYQLEHPAALSDVATLHRHESALEQLPDEAPESCCHGMDKLLREAEANTQAMIDGRQIGDQIAQHVIDAADYLVDQLNTFEQRFAGHIDRFALIHVEHQAPAPPPPPPDPVLESERYQEMIAAGVEAETAYSVVEKLLHIETVQPGATVPQAAPDAPESTNDPEPGHPGRQSYEDSPRGRCQRIADILAGGERTFTLDKAEFAAWQELEASENKHSVKGEVPAFEQLYPAIVTAARANVGEDLLDFIDVDAAIKGKAPWDRDPAPSRMEDSVLEGEIAVMLDELRQSNDPRCMVQDRIIEKGADGVERRETIEGYHRRVSAVYKQMQRLKTMGAM